MFPGELAVSRYTWPEVNVWCFDDLTSDWGMIPRLLGLNLIHFEQRLSRRVNPGKTASQNFYHLERCLAKAKLQEVLVERKGRQTRRCSRLPKIGRRRRQHVLEVAK